MNISKLNTTAKIEDEEARNTKPSQRDSLGCFSLVKRRRKQRALTMNISCYHQLAVESADCAFLRVAFTSSEFIDPIIYLFNLLIKIKFLSLDKNFS